MLQDFVCLFAKNLEQGLIIILKFTLNVFNRYVLQVRKFEVNDNIKL